MSGESYNEPYLPGGVVTPGGYHAEGHRANARRFTDVMMDGLHWVRKRLNGPGAMNYALETIQLAESTPIGPGVRQRQYWATISTPLFVPYLSRPTSGYGGVIQGQAIYQPLFDPYNNTFGNIKG